MAIYKHQNNILKALEDSKVIIDEILKAVIRDSVGADKKHQEKVFFAGSNTVEDILNHHFLNSPSKKKN